MASPRIAGKNARLYVADVPLYLDAFEAEDQIELNLEDGTPFGADWREMTLIDGQISLSINAFMDTKRPPDFTADYVTDRAYWDTAIDGSNNIKANPNVPIIFVPGASALRGDPAKFLNCILGSLNINTPRSGLGKLQGRFAASGQYGNGFIIAQVEQSFTGGVETFIPTSGGTDIKVAGTLGTMAALCVYKKSGSSSFTIKVQDSTTSGGSYGDAITFAAFTAVGAQFKRDVVDAGKQFHRVSVYGDATETLGLIIVSTNI